MHALIFRSKNAGAKKGIGSGSLNGPRHMISTLERLLKPKADRNQPCGDCPTTLGVFDEYAYCYRLPYHWHRKLACRDLNLPRTPGGPGMS